MVGRYEPTNKPSGYRVYISSKDYPILEDMLSDVNAIGEHDIVDSKTFAARERLINKLLGINIKEGGK